MPSSLCFHVPQPGDPYPRYSAVLPPHTRKGRLPHYNKALFHFSFNTLYTTTTMILADYLPILLQVLIAAAIAIGILVASHIFGQRARGNYMKDAPYECGIPMEGKPHPRFALKFYVVAMLFILFDIEVVFLVPWVLVYREFLAHNIAILLPVLFFIFVLTLGLVYEMKKKGLRWAR